MVRSRLLVKMPLKTCTVPCVTLWSMSGMKTSTEERWGKREHWIVLSLFSIYSLFELHSCIKFQVKKVKNYKREKWRTGSNFFQKIQDQRNKWSVLPGGKRAFGVRRWRSPDWCWWTEIKTTAPNSFSSSLFLFNSSWILLVSIFQI